MPSEVVLDTCQECGTKVRARWQVQKIDAEGLPSVIWDFCAVDCLVHHLAPRSMVD